MHDALVIADWIGEHPETVIAVAALRSGRARWWVDGDVSAPGAVLVEPALLPGELQGFGDGKALIDMLEPIEGWWCVELEPGTAAAVAERFTERWGRATTLTDVVHRLDQPVATFDHPLVKELTADEALHLPTLDVELLPDRQQATSAAAAGRLIAAVERGAIVGRASAFAAGRTFADVGVHVGHGHRGQGIARACASTLCRRLQDDGLVPVWSTSSANVASLATAARLGFVEVARLRYLVRGDR